MTETTNDNGDGENTPTELESKIIRQIEYYFGDHNLARDKFLQEQVKLDDGWIPLDVLTKFNRLKSLTTDFPTIAAALKKSTADLLEVHEDGAKIRRNTDKPLPEITDEYKQEIQARTVYAKPFPEDLTIDELLEFFKTQGSVENIIMRRQDKQFDGSVFATFKTKEEADEFLKKEEVKYKDTDLIRELRSDFHKRKAANYAELKKEKKSKQLVDEKENEKEKVEDVMVKDCCVKITGMDDTTTREDIKAVFSPFGEVAWVDSKVGDVEAIIRFKEEGDGKTLIEKVREENDGKILIKEKEVEAHLLQDEEELKYWEIVQDSMAERRKKSSGGHKRVRGFQGKRGRGRGGRDNRGSRRSQRLSGGEKRSADNDSLPAAKQAKTE